MMMMTQRNATQRNALGDEDELGGVGGGDDDGPRWRFGDEMGVVERSRGWRLCGNPRGMRGCWELDSCCSGAVVRVPATGRVASVA